MKKSYLVSIIIPTYNRAHLIAETLDSVLAQTYTNWECIVVDDGSTDKTEAILSDYIAKDKRFQYHKRPDNHLPGGNGARNYGFKMSNGEYIQWFDSDDLMLHNKIELKLSKLLSDKNLICCFSSFAYFEEDTIEIEELSDFESNNLFKDIVKKKIKINTPSTLWKKSFLEEKTLFNESIFRGQELDFYTRMFGVDESIKHTKVSAVLSHIRIGDGSSIMNDFAAIYNIKLVKSFFKVRQNIQLLVLNKNDEELYIAASNFYLTNILRSIRFKDFKTSIENLIFLRKHSFKNRLSYRFKFLLLIFLTKMLNIFDGKGYDKVKKYFVL